MTIPNHPCPGILAERLSLSFGADIVFDSLDLQVPGGRCLALLGASGVGKTTLLKLIAGLEPPSAGRIIATDGAPLTGRISYMAQQDLLLPWLCVLDNAMLGAKLRREPPDRGRALHLLECVGLAERAKALPGELSGGMRQRAALARTLYEDRPIVLMDEPFSALDTITRARIQELAAETLAGRTVLLITHDPLEACRLGHRLVVMAGSPARLGRPIAVAGPPPRAVDASDLLRTQGELLRQLSEQTPP